VTDPLTILRGALIPWLRPLASGGAHWLRAQLQAGQAVTPPYLVVELPGPGTDIPAMGVTGWQGDVRVKVNAADLAQAEQLAEQARAVVLAARFAPDPVWAPGWSFKAEWRSPLVPSIGRIATAGFLVRITLIRR
jgi:hypothetical protein